MANKLTCIQLEQENIALQKKVHAMQELEKRLLEVEQLANIGHWDWDILNKKLTWSDEIFRIFGVTRETFDVSAENFESTIHPDDIDFFLSEREKALKAENDVSIVHRIIRPNGEIRVVHERATVIRENKQAIRILGTVQDITEREQSERESKEIDDIFKKYLESTSDIVFTLNHRKEHIGVYGNWTEKCGFSNSVLEGKTATEVLGEKAKIHEEAYDRALNDEIVVYEWNVVVGGKKHYYRTSLTPLKERGRVIGVLGVGRDITCLKLEQVALEERERKLWALFNAY